MLSTYTKKVRLKGLKSRILPLSKSLKNLLHGIDQKREYNAIFSKIIPV